MARSAVGSIHINGTNHKEKLQRDVIWEKTPLQEEVANLYDPAKEHIQQANYYLETQLRKLK